MDISSRTQVGASAPGKVIIFGEHFVVYNNEAVVAAINKRCFGRAELTKNFGVRIDSNLEWHKDPYSKQRATKTNAQANGKLLEPLSSFCRNILKDCASEIGLQIHIKSELVVGVGLGRLAARRRFGVDPPVVKDVWDVDDSPGVFGGAEDQVVILRPLVAGPETAQSGEQVAAVNREVGNVVVAAEVVG